MRGNYEEMEPVDDQPFDWSWVLIIVLMIALFVSAFVAGQQDSKGADLPPWQVSPVTTTPGRPGYDPYHAGSYAEFLEVVTARGRGILYVGVSDQSTGRYEYHYSVPTGFRGFPPGVYDCFFDPTTGQPKMDIREVLQAPGVAAPRPFTRGPLPPGGSGGTTELQGLPTYTSANGAVRPSAMDPATTSTRITYAPPAAGRTMGYTSPGGVPYRFSDPRAGFSEECFGSS